MATTDIQRGFLLAEDEAMKAKLSGLTVAAPRESGGRKRVKTYYRFPSEEMERTYPFITIERTDIAFAADRAHSAEITAIDYWPSEWETFAEYAVAHGLTDFDIDLASAEATRWHPYDIHYQVATYARSAQHDAEMTATLLGTAYLPDRWGYLDVPADGSSRWLDRVGYAQADLLEVAGGTTKRTFRKIYNVTVSAHLPPEDPFVFGRVLAVMGLITVTNDSSLTATWTDEQEAP